MTNLQVSHLYKNEVVHVKLSQLVSVTSYLYITSVDIEDNCSRWLWSCLLATRRRGRPTTMALAKVTTNNSRLIFSRWCTCPRNNYISILTCKDVKNSLCWMKNKWIWFISLCDVRRKTGLFTKICHFVPFFQKAPFVMDFIWKMKLKSSFFIWNIKKTCAARGSLRSLPHPSLPPPTFRYQNERNKRLMATIIKKT